MKKIVFVILFVAVFFATAENAMATNWVRIEGWMKEFSLRMPEGYFAYKNREKNVIALSSYKDKVSINVSVNGALAPRQRLVGLEDKYDTVDCKYDYYTQGPLAGKIFTCQSDKQFSKTIYMATQSRFFKIVVGADSPNNVNVSLFLMALKFQGAPTFPSYREPPDPRDKVISEHDIKSDPLVKEYSKMADHNPRFRQSRDTTEKLIDADTPIYSRPVIIVKSEKVKTPIGLLKDSQSIRVKLKIRFKSNGEIDEVELLDSNNNDYATAVADSVRGMRFVPAQIDGIDVTVTRILEFGYDTL